MNLHHLETFLAVAKHQNFSRAAEELYLSQSAVSIQIKQLEEEFGIPLFDRLGRATKKTIVGEIFEERALQILGIIREIYQSIEDVKGLERGHVAVGASFSPGIYILPKILGVYKQRYPQVKLDYEIADTQQIEQMVLRNQLDFGVVGGHLIEQDLNIEPYLTDQLILVVGANHPLAAESEVKLKTIQHMPFILRHKGSAARKVIEKAFEKRRLRLNSIIELQDPEAVKQMVIAGCGATIMSKEAVRKELADGELVHIRAKGLPLTRQLVIVSRRNKRLSVAAQALLKLLRE